MSAARARSTEPKPKAAGKLKAVGRASEEGSSRTAEQDGQAAALLPAWFRHLARCRAAWLQQLWTGDGSIEGRASVTHMELAGILEDHDSPEAQAAWAEAQEPVRHWQSAAEEMEAALDALTESRLFELCRAFDLSRAEIRLLRLCAAVSLDASLGRACAYLQDQTARAYLTEELAARLLGYGRRGPWKREMNLFRWELVVAREAAVAEPDAWICDPLIRDWLLGKSSLPDVLIGAMKRVESWSPGLREWPVESIAGWITGRIREQEPARVVVVAPRGGGKAAFVDAVARELGRRVLRVDAGSPDEAGWARFFLQAQRQAILEIAFLAWTGDAILRRPWPAHQLMAPVQFVLCEPGREAPAVEGMIDRHVRLPMPEAETRVALWLHSTPKAKGWPRGELHRLAEQYSVWPGDIEQAGRIGPDTPANAAELVREAARSRFGNLAQILETSFTPDDLVLPDGLMRMLDAFVFEALERGELWRQPEPRRLFPQGRGLIALFSGPSGTGKTMAAQVIAKRLGQDLCRVNIAHLMSKWVGDTPKNIQEVIRTASDNNAVLFFDEADTLFAKRSADLKDAQDRFANADTGSLLQEIEGYCGVGILSTNLKSNIDLAFLRRLRILVEFPKPDAGLQRTLWTKLVTALAGEGRARALRPAFELLSTSPETTGAHIKFAILAALFAARAENVPLSARHLLLGLDRELGKEGRTLGPRERERILKLEQAI